MLHIESYERHQFSKKIVFCAVFSFIPNIYFSGYRINADVITVLLELVGGGGGSDDDRAVAAHTKKLFFFKVLIFDFFLKKA